MSELPTVTSDTPRYLLGHSAIEDERLRQQAGQLAADANWHVDQVGIQPSQRVIDVGYGPQGIIDLLAARVGPRGSVVGLERRESAVALARQFVAEHNLTNVEIVYANVRETDLPRESFDLVHLRLVLVIVPNPREIIAQLVALARPGGQVAIHDADAATFFCEPSHPSWDRLIRAFQRLGREMVMDHYIGRKLPMLMREAGLVDVQVRPVVHLSPMGHPRRLIPLQFIENVRHELVGRGLLTDAEIDDSLASLRAHLDDPNTLVMSHLFFQAWGRKP
jgi:2-polyprenyl-3-methyl-5-hydroxy-6-metoxy-1,4-benzoquinol methylase